MSILNDGDYDEGFAIALACKDLGLSIDLSRSVGVAVELSGLVEQVFRRARASHGDRAGEMTPFRCTRTWSARGSDWIRGGGGDDV